MIFCLFFWISGSSGRCWPVILGCDW